MRVIHVVGNVKTHDIYGIMPNSSVVDSKELLNGYQRSKLNSNPAKAHRRWVEYLTDHINAVCSQATTENVIFVGPLDDCSPKGTSLEFPNGLAKKYYVDSTMTELSRPGYLRNGYEPLSLAHLEYHLNSPNFLIGDLDSFASGLYKRMTTEFKDVADSLVDENGVIRDENLINRLRREGMKPDGDTHHMLSMLWQKLKYPKKKYENPFQGTIGQLDDNYEIVNKLGSGAFGQVLHARNKKRREPDVAIKLFTGNAKSSYEAETRIHEWLTDEFGNERQHENLLMYYGRFITRYQNVPYFGMKIEYFSGQSLEAMIDKGYVFKDREYGNICVSVLSALDFLLGYDICHRDVKPANIMYNADMNRVFLIDLGLASFSQDVINRTNGVTSRVAGSPLFLSPELFDLNQIYDADRIKEILYKNDVWSLGMTISKLITEKLFPWWKATSMDDLIDALNPPFFEANLKRAYNILDAEKGKFPELVEFIKQMLTPLDKRPSVSNALTMFKTHYFPESCVKCENVASKVCSKCNVPYCSDECQVSAWTEHRNICGKK